MSIPAPVLAIGTLLATAGSAVAQQMAAQQQARQQNAVYQANAENARAGLINDYDQLTRRQIQEQDASAVRQDRARRAAREAQGTAMVSAGEAGVTGLSIDALLGDYARQGGEIAADETANLDATLDQIGAMARGAQVSAQNRINSVPRSRAPGWLGTGLRIIAAGAQGVSDWNKGGGWDAVRNWRTG